MVGRMTIITFEEYFKEKLEGPLLTFMRERGNMTGREEQEILKIILKETWEAGYRAGVVEAP